MALNIDEILAGLEDGQTAEDAFQADMLSDEEEKTASVEDEEDEEQQEAEKSAEAENTTEEEEADMKKRAALADEEGRVIARAFMDELQKQGVAMAAEYPADPGALPNNPAVETPRGEAAQPHMEQTAKVEALLRKLTTANKVGAGEVGTSAQVEPQQHTAPVEHPVAADVTKQQEREATQAKETEKTSSQKGAEYIVSTLYQNNFGEEEN